MPLTASIFKAYDVRGLSPEELDADGAYRIARAYVDVFEPASVVVGHDMRVTSPELAAAAIRGVTDAGADAVSIGLVGTEVMYYTVGEHGYEGGIQVTASHNPKEYNGMKIVRRGGLPVGGDSGLDRVRDAALAGGFKEPHRKGTVSEREVLSGYTEKVLSFVDTTAIAPLQVVLDGASGMAGVMLERVLPRLPITATSYFLEPDGTFPDHQPNPLLPENRKFIIEKVVEQGADLGIAWDGDADRCFFIDDTGEFVPGDFITALLAESILAKHPGATILYDLRASDAVPDVVAANGGTAIESRVGHAFIKLRMREEQATFAGEVSGHYYFGEFYSVDAGIPPALLILELVSKSGKRLSELLAPLRERYFISGEINTRVGDVPLKLQELKDAFGGPGATVTHLDGVSIRRDAYHFNVRPSNTEPLLRLNLEAFSQADMELYRDEVLGVIER